MSLGINSEAFPPLIALVLALALQHRKSEERRRRHKAATEQESAMSMTVSFRSLPASAGSTASRRHPSGVASLPIHFGRLLADARKQLAEQQMAIAVEMLDHPGVIADFHRAS